MQASGRSWLLRTVIRWIEALLRAVCAMQRDCVHGCPTAEGCVLAALRAQERGAGCTVCAAECARLVAGLCCAEAGSVRKDGGTALVPAAGLTRRRPVCSQHTEATARGASAQRHGSASLAEEEPHPERHRSNTSRCFSKMLPWSRCCVPMKKSCN